MVNTHFDAVSQHYEDTILAESKKCGFHNEYRLESLNNVLGKEISNLVSHAQELNNNFLKSVKRVKTEVLANSQLVHEKIVRELEAN